MTPWTMTVFGVASETWSLVIGIVSLAKLWTYLMAELPGAVTCEYMCTITQPMNTHY